MQLHLSHDPLGLHGLPRYSYVRVHELHEVPRQILVDEWLHGKHLELKEKSYNGLAHFLRMRGLMA